MTPDQATAAARGPILDPEIRPFDMAPGPRVIGLTGRAGAGKSTAAAGLVARGYTLVKFAAPLKAMLAALYASQGVSPDDIARRIEGDRKELPDPVLGFVSPRFAMQTLGTEWGRDCMARDFWLSLWHRRAAAILDQGGGVVCDDCRFENEAAALRNLGGVVVGITRPGANVAPAHASEAPQPADRMVDNTGTPAALAAAILSDLERITP